MSEPLFDYVENQELRMQVKKAAEVIKHMQAAANGTRELRHQQAKTIEKQRAEIIELQRTVKRLSEELEAAR